MQEKLWFFQNWSYYNFEIKEAQVLKETEKTFVVKANFQQTVKKEKMETYGYHFFLSKEQAEQGLINYLKAEIDTAESEIERQKTLIDNRKNILKERFNVEVK